MTRPLAEDILSLGLPQHDADRAAELNAKVNEGTLAESEEAELEAYINVTDLLAFWQSGPGRRYKIGRERICPAKSGAAPGLCECCRIPRLRSEGRFTLSTQSRGSTPPYPSR